jgi:hypothetical protein
MTITLTPSGVGTGASSVLLGSDNFGGFSFTTGTGSSSGQAATLTFTVEQLKIGPSLELVPLNAAAVNMQAGASFFAGIASNKAGFTISGTLADSTVYQFAYRVL